MSNSIRVYKHKSPDLYTVQVRDRGTDVVQILHLTQRDLQRLERKSLECINGSVAARLDLPVKRRVRARNRVSP